MENFSRIQIENAKDAYITLFNALGPEHYATLDAEFRLALKMYESDDSDKKRTLAYAEEAFEGLKKKDKEELLFPLVEAAVLYAYLLCGANREEDFIKLHDYILENFTDTADKDDRIDLEDYLQLTISKAECLIALGKKDEAIMVLINMFCSYLENFGFDDMTETMLIRTMEIFASMQAEVESLYILTTVRAFITNELMELYGDGYEEEASIQELFPFSFLKLCEALFIVKGKERETLIKEVIEELTEAEEKHHQAKDEDDEEPLDKENLFCQKLHVYRTLITSLIEQV